MCILCFYIMIMKIYFERFACGVIHFGLLGNQPD